jgi:bifunctional non-homologous end joining protein LigD
MLPLVRDRPLSLVRCPAGQDEHCFFQRHATKDFPRVIRRVPAQEEAGKDTFLAVDSLAGLVYLVQIGVLEMHAWGARRDRLDRPDRLVLDLDPAPELPWARVVEAARETRKRLDALGLRSFVKTTGGKGLHVVAPLTRRHSWEEVREFAHALSEALERDAPQRYTTRAAKAERAGKIYLDYLRNARGASAVAAYSTRARPGAPVAMPLDWEDLTPELSPDLFTVQTVPERIARRADPWQEIGQVRQSLTRAVWNGLKSG